MAERKVCSWCGRSHDQVKRLFAGPPQFICNLCVENMGVVLAGEESELAARVRDEIDQAVQDSFQHMVKQLNLGPLQDKYQRLMHVKFEEDADGPSFQEVFFEFKKGVEAEVPGDDYQTRYDLAIAYSEMGLVEDAFREMVQSLAGALRQRNFDRASEVISALLFIHKDSARAIKAVFGAMCQAGVE